MAVATIQSSFAGGEITQALNARIDLDKFDVGAAMIRNFVVDYRGGVEKRPGTEFIVEAKDTGTVVRLVPFIVSSETSYVLEFGDQYIRFISNGVQLESSPGVPYEIATVYLAADLFRLKFAQSADVLTITHPTYRPQNLLRTSDTTFEMEVIEIGAEVQPTEFSAITAPFTGDFNYGYVVTAVSVDGKEESRPSSPEVKHTEVLNELENKVVQLAWDPSPTPASRYNIYKWGPQAFDATLGHPPASAWGYIGSAVTTRFVDINIAQNFGQQPPVVGDPINGGQIIGVEVATGGAYTNGTDEFPLSPYVPLIISGDGAGAAGFAIVDPVAGEVVSAWITYPGRNYTSATATAGAGGATFTFTFSDIEPLYPSCASYLQQRRMYAGAAALPASFSLSQIGKFNNFDTTPNASPTDAISGIVSSQEVQEIRSLVPVSYGVLAFSSGGVFLINGGSPGAAVTPETISVTQQASPGANYLQPLLINYDIIFGQEKGNRLRNASFAWEKQSYTVGDITQLAPHLFDGYATVDWAWSEEPFKVIWAVRDDGRMVSCTYVPEQQVYAWARHDTQGLFKSVCVVPEGEENAVYVAVQRYIPDSDPDACWKTYIERLHPALTCCLFDAWFLDSALSLTSYTVPSTIYITQGVGNEVTITSYDPCEEDPGGGPFLGSGYLMESLENLSTDLIAVVDGEIVGGVQTDTIVVASINPGIGYDRVNRRIMYSVGYMPSTDGTATNDTGFDIWTGVHEIADAAAYDQRTYNNFSICAKDVDGGGVTRYDAYDSTSMVPNGIGPSDGTFRRFVEAHITVQQAIKVVDPRTGNVWSHHVSNATVPSRTCLIYEFRQEDDYALTISPYVPDADIHLELFGINDDWVMIGEQDIQGSLGLFTMQLLPRLRTTDEVTADYLLSYAEFAAPGGTVNYVLASQVAADGNLWWFGQFVDSGPTVYKLWKFTMPTSAPFGGPVVGGGWTEETPWVSGAGPDAPAAAYRAQGLTRQPIQVVYNLPEDTLVATEALYPANLIAGASTDPNDFHWNVTYIDLTGGTYTQHDDVVTGYMTAEWVPTADPDEAAFAVVSAYALDPDLRYHSFEFDTVNYARRWFAFCTRPVVGGVIQGGAYPPGNYFNFTNMYIVLVEYDFSDAVGGPTAVTVYPEAGWDAAYTTYATDIGIDEVVGASFVGYQSTTNLIDAGFFDETGPAWWSSGFNTNFWAFDADTQPREDYMQQPPFLRLSLGDVTPTVEAGDTLSIDCGRIRITEVVDAETLLGEVIDPLDLLIPDDPDGRYVPVLTGHYTFSTPTQVVSGLDHLEGKEVYALADGEVLGPFTVVGGTVDLGAVYSSIVVGLRYTSELKTLYLTAEGLNKGTEQGKRKKISGVTWRTDCTMNVEHSIDGVLYNPLPDTYADTTLATVPFTGDARALTYPDWDTYGVMWARSADPLPAHINGVIIEVTPGDTGA